jgi:hypothetical protein
MYTTPETINYNALIDQDYSSPAKMNPQDYFKMYK